MQCILSNSSAEASATPAVADILTQPRNALLHAQPQPFAHRKYQA